MSCSAVGIAPGIGNGEGFAGAPGTNADANPIARGVSGVEG